MPYIKQEQRELIDGCINDLLDAISRVGVPLDGDLRDYDGVLNYTITRLLGGTLELNEPRYTKFNTALGVLEGVKLELYRRQVAPYEDIKISENGDVQ